MTTESSLLRIAVFAVFLAFTQAIKTKEMREARQKEDGMYFPGVLKTPLKCYHCHNAESHEKCNERGLVQCELSQDSCETEIRMMNIGARLVPSITKGCKQTQACKNNYRQNDRPGWPSTQCNEAEYFPLYVCRYCCGEAGCNSNTGEPHCRKLLAPSNGWMECGTMSGVTSSVCKFGCDECFELKGPETRTCKSDKKWSGEETECIYDSECGVPKCDIGMTSPIENGDVTCSKGNSEGSICEFSCMEGYQMMGKKKVECAANGLQWDNTKPACEEGDTQKNPCHKFATFEFSRNGSLTCKCRQGFEGDGAIDCNDLDEGSSPELNHCHEHATCTNTVGSYTCKCDQGFMGDGFECIDVNECVTEEHDCDVNGVCKNNVGSFSCACAPGYIGDGRRCKKNDVKCPQEQLKDGLYCIRKDATEVATITESATTMTTSAAAATTRATPMQNSTTETTRPVVTATTAVTTTNISIVVATTTKGAPSTQAVAINDMTGATTTTEATTTSSSEIDWCVSFERGVPPVMKEEKVYKQVNDVLQSRVVPSDDNTTVILGPWIGLDDRFDDTVMRWRDGCEITDGQFNKWAPGEPQISTEPGVNNCVHLVSDPISYGTRDFLWKVVKCSESLRYSCDTERTKHEGKGLKVCKPRVGNIANGAVSCSDGWNINSVCNFTCEEGFLLQEEYSKIVCMEQSLTWNKPPPNCICAACSPPLSPPNEGNMTCSDDNNIGSECKFACNKGYRIQGNNKITCQEDLEWSASRPCCRDDCPPYARMNLIFVLDSSSSVGRGNFYHMKEFVSGVAKRFILSTDFTQVAAIIYHSKVIPLNDNKIFDSNIEFEAAIGKLSYDGIGTYTGLAIEYVTENLVARREGAKDVVILLTDGKSLDDVTEPAQNLRQQNVHVIAVGVEGARSKELELIASKPVADNIVAVDSFEELERTVYIIKDLVCNSQC